MLIKTSNLSYCFLKSSAKFLTESKSVRSSSITDKLDIPVLATISYLASSALFLSLQAIMTWAPCLTLQFKIFLIYWNNLKLHLDSCFFTNSSICSRYNTYLRILYNWMISSNNLVQYIIIIKYLYLLTPPLKYYLPK